MDPDAAKEVYQGAFTDLESSNHLMVRWDELNQIWNNHLSAYFLDENGDTAATMQAIETDLNDALIRIADENSSD